MRGPKNSFAPTWRSADAAPATNGNGVADHGRALVEQLVRSAVRDLGRTPDQVRESCEGATRFVNDSAGSHLTVDEVREVVEGVLAQLSTPLHATSPLHQNPCKEADVAAVAEVTPADGGAGAALLDRIVAALSTYVQFVDETQVHAVALWIAYTHAVPFDVSDTHPYLAVTSAEKRSGKTRLIEVVELLVREPWRVSSTPTISTLFRHLDATAATLLLDEADEIFASSGDSIREIRAALNSGYRAGATIPRTEGDRANRQVVNFSVSSPKLLAGLRAEAWPDTTRDRCIVVGLRRRAGDERVQRFRYRDAAPALNELRDELAQFIATHADQIRDLRVDDIASIDDRKAECWESPRAIAEVIGGPWPDRAYRAAIELSTSDVETDSIGVRLLRDLRDAFNVHQQNGKLASAVAIDALNARDDAPWRSYRDGQGIDAFKLSKLLRPFGISTRTIRIGERVSRGWEIDELRDAWTRYLPSPGHPSEPATSATVATSQAGQGQTRSGDVARSGLDSEGETGS